jgi:hypothetical protein
MIVVTFTYSLILFFISLHRIASGDLQMGQDAHMPPPLQNIPVPQNWLKYLTKHYHVKGKNVTNYTPTRQRLGRTWAKKAELLNLQSRRHLD